MTSTGIPSAIILYLINRALDPAIIAQKNALAQASKHANAAVTAIDLVKVYNGSDHEVSQYVKSIRRSAKHYFRQALCNCAQMGYIKLWMITLFVVGFYFAVVLFDQGELSPGNALTTFYAALTAFQSMEAIGPQWLTVIKGKSAGQALKRLVATGTEQEDHRSGGGHRPMSCQGHIQLNSVSINVDAPHVLIANIH